MVSALRTEEPVRTPALSVSLSNAVKAVADSITAMVQASQQAAYLAGAGSHGATAGRATGLTPSEAALLAGRVEAIHTDARVLMAELTAQTVNGQTSELGSACGEQLSPLVRVQV
ncbi:unnamed protein product [Protopolystoma xenopodis]|uniref:Uncharacterized protein n=1 Tax=Protopolystoma xenopodis TaxID=117903 RepID=A0A448X8J2_9PLAT|nr:unnamed protein product [Protopolystoma xenopodis]